MIYYNRILHNRRSIRLKRYDYSLEGLYFITLCVQDRIPLFGEIARQEWLNTTNVRDNVALHQFIIMPDHFHAILEITFKKGTNEKQIGEFKSPTQTIGSIIRGYKIATTKKIKDRWADCTVELQFASTQFAPTAPTQFDRTKIWQRNYYEHIIRAESDYDRITQYIKNNPANWKKDTK